jgi:hypothetical protein
VCTDVIQLTEAILQTLPSRVHTAHDTDTACDTCHAHCVLYELILSLLEYMAPADEVRIPVRDPSKVKDFQQGKGYFQNIAFELSAVNNATNFSYNEPDFCAVRALNDAATPKPRVDHSLIQFEPSTLPPVLKLLLSLLTVSRRN